MYICVINYYDMKKFVLMLATVLCLVSCDKFFQMDTRTSEEILAEEAEAFGFHFDKSGVVIPSDFEPANDSSFYAVFSGTAWLKTYSLKISRSGSLATTNYFDDNEKAGKGLSRTHLSIEKDSTFFSFFYDYDTKEACYARRNIEFVNEYGAFKAEGSDLPYEHLLLTVSTQFLETVDCVGEDSDGYIFCYSVYSRCNESQAESLKTQYTVER